MCEWSQWEREGGRAEGRAESVLELLREVDDVPESLQKIIEEQTDIAVLKSWLKLAAKVETLEEFEEQIGLLLA